MSLAVKFPYEFAADSRANSYFLLAVACGVDPACRVLKRTNSRVVIELTPESAAKVHHILVNVLDERDELLARMGKAR